MSVLFAAEGAVSARKSMHRLYKSLKEAEIDPGHKSDILENCETLSKELDQLVADLEHALVPEGSTVSITYHPFDIRDVESKKRVLREGGEGYSPHPRKPRELRGTFVFPAEDPLHSNTNGDHDEEPD